MSVDTTGFNETASEAAIQNVISGGATVHLFGGGDTANYSDTGTEVSNKSDASVQVDEADFTIDTPSDFSGVATLSNDNDLDYGALDIGVVDDIIIQNDSNSDLFVVGNEPNDPDLTGEDVTLPADTTLYELGNPT